jgi:hypothetical protein
MKQKTSKIENFIGIYDNYITEDECKKAIKLFESQNKLNKTLNRTHGENVGLLEKQDRQYFATGENIDVWWEELKSLMVNYEIAWLHYAKNTGGADAYGLNSNNFKLTNLKIQKTLPTEGYHIWHVEHGRGYHNEPRAFVFSIYLNNIEKGGETEFLNQSCRVKPKTGRIVIWPAGFPYVHRGNSPLSGEKYILTSWMMLR